MLIINIFMGQLHIQVNPYIFFGPVKHKELIITVWAVKKNESIVRFFLGGQLLVNLYFSSSFR